MTPYELRDNAAVLDLHAGTVDAVTADALRHAAAELRALAAAMDAGLYALPPERLAWDTEDEDGKEVPGVAFAANGTYRLYSNGNGHDMWPLYDEDGGKARLAWLTRQGVPITQAQEVCQADYAAWRAGLTSHLTRYTGATVAGEQQEGERHE